MRWIGAASVLVAGVVIASATAAPSRDALVQPGRGIGRITLGMTQAQARRVLGPHQFVVKRRELGFGQRFVELQWGYAEWSVGFQGRRGRLRAVMVGTTLRSQRTRSGLGVGSRVRDVLRVHPNATCSDWVGIGTNSSKEMWLTVRHANGARTVFAFVGDGKADPGPVHVVEVMVRLPASGLSERRGPCGPNWRGY